MADNRIYFPRQPLLPPSKSGINAPSGQSSHTVANTGAAFNQLLNQELAGVKFSQHALQRMQSRNISLNDADLIKLNGAVEKAAQKGAKESLVLMNNLALVVSVKNKTVITALDGASMKDNVFTNIDSAVIV